jgi:hypothetical protein
LRRYTTRGSVQFRPSSSPLCVLTHHVCAPEGFDVRQRPSSLVRILRGADGAYDPGMTPSARTQLSSRVAALACVGLTAALSGCSAATSAAGDSEQVSWRDAAEHAGDTATVCGPLKSTGSDGNDRFLNLGAPYPEQPRFTIVVWDNPNSVKDVDAEKERYQACATGEVSMYDGVPQIQLDDGDDIILTPR